MENADPEAILALALAALLIYGAHAGVVGIKHGVHKIFSKPVQTITQPIRHPKKDLKAVIHHETAVPDHDDR